MSPEQVKAARHKLGLKQSQLAEVIGVEPRTLRRWEEDRQSNSFRRINRQAAKLIEWLLDGYRPPNYPR